MDDETNVPPGVGPVVPSPEGQGTGGGKTAASETTKGKAEERGAEGTTITEPKNVGGSVDKTSLEIDKLQLEIGALKYKRSFLGRTQDVIVALGPLAALCALVWTIHVGLLQQKQQQLDAASARFERAYTKLGSQLPSERASAVAQLSGLLHTDSARDQEMLTALVNQLALDDNPAVTSAILNVFQHLDNQTAKPALDAALKSAIQLQNVLERSSGLTLFELSTALRDARGQFLALPEYDPKGDRSARPVDENAQQSLASLFALRRALMSLLKAGATPKDLGWIFCPGCDFGQLGVNMNDVNFHNGILNGTRWDGLQMERTNFQDAILDHSSFSAANLQGAKFNQDEHNRNRQLDLETRVYRYAAPFSRVMVGGMDGSTDFTCADLRNATFDHFPLVVRASDAQPIDSTQLVRPITSSIFYRGANIEGTNFQRAREIVLEELKPGGEKASPYIAMDMVDGPQGAHYRYYTRVVPLESINNPIFHMNPQTFRLDKIVSDSPDVRRGIDASVQAVAEALSETRNYEKANLPAGVLAAIQANPASHVSTEGFCKGWVDGMKQSHASGRHDAAGMGEQ